VASSFATVAGVVGAGLAALALLFQSGGAGAAAVGSTVADIFAKNPAAYKGPKGDKGDNGPRGYQGDTGAQGPIGTTDYNDLTNKPNLATVATSGSYNDLTNKPTIVEKTTGSWTLAAGANTVSLTVPINGTYSIWVNGNIPNGIVTYTATVVVTNTNVPVVGNSYGWYYVDGNALVLTAIPNQVVGTANGISTAVVSTTTANVFTFGITNNSGSDQVVNWGYTKL
jgi:hypothetical protein